jgi:hypothetical protein
MYSNSAAGAINMRAHTTKVSTSFISCKKYTDFRTANNAYYYMLQIDFLFSSISCLNYGRSLGSVTSAQLLTS